MSMSEGTLRYRVVEEKVVQYDRFNRQTTYTKRQAPVLEFQDYAGHWHVVPTIVVTGEVK